MTVALVIPARYASTRYPGKPLVDLAGRSLIRRSWDAAQAVRGIDRVIVATDDERIADHARSFGAEVAMTSPDCRNGTERVAEALAGTDVEIAVNLQGDAPLTPPWFVEALVAALRDDPSVGMATPVLRCDATTYAMFVEDRRAGRVGGTTAVFGATGDALYFSKEVIPWIDPAKLPDPPPVWHHVGVYAYRPAALSAYLAWPEGRLERLEGLEQLRFLENGHPVRCVEVDARGRVFWEVNNPADVPRVEAALAAT